MRCQHEIFLGEQYRDNNGAVKKYIDSLRIKTQYEIEPHRQVISSAEIMKEVKSENSKPSTGFGHVMPFIKEFWEDVN